jgi:hypothetical protein
MQERSERMYFDRYIERERKSEGEQWTEKILKRRKRYVNAYMLGADSHVANNGLEIILFRNAQAWNRILIGIHRSARCC